MVTTDFLNSMYDKFIDNRELTEKELLSIGFTSEDLSELKEKGKIASVKSGIYSLVDADGLVNYSYMLPKDRHYSVYKRCLEIEPTSTKFATTVFNYSLWANDFDTTLKCFDILDTPDYRKNQNLRLLLLSYITDLGEEYRERVRNLTVDDVIFDERTAQLNASIYDANFKVALAISSHYKKVLQILYFLECFHKQKKFIGKN